MAPRQILTASILVALLYSPIAAQPPTIEEAVKLVETAGNETHRKHLERWQLATKIRTWKDSDGTRTIEARYVDSNDSDVTLEKKNGDRVTFAQDKLQVNSRIRIKEIQKIASQVTDDAVAIKATVEAANAERHRRELAENKRLKFEASLTPEQRTIRATAKELSQAGLDRENALIQELVGNTGSDNGVRLLLRVQNALKMLDEFTEHYGKGTLTDSNVKKIVKQYGDSKGGIADLERVLFGDGNKDVANVLIKEQPLVTRLDVYYAAGRALKPEVRESYGFSHIKVFERMGNKLYWDYIHDEKQKKK